jgi:hypothetical protein
MFADRFAIETCELLKKARLNEKKWVNVGNIYKKELLENYFSKCEILLDKIGLTIATATLQERKCFDTKKFGEEHPDLLEKYLTQTVYQTILVK